MGAQGFKKLPKELLVKVLEEFDTASILKCTTLSTYFNAAGVDVILRRHEITNPNEYCRVGAVVNKTYRPPPADVLAALLASAYPLNRVKHLYCSVRLSSNTKGFQPETLQYPDHSPDRLEITGMFALQRISLVLSKIQALEKVTLNLSGLKYGLEAQTINGPLADLINTIIQKGCRTLEVKCKVSPYGDDKPWSFPIPDKVHKSATTRRFTISSILSSIFSLCGLFRRISSRKESTGRSGHRRLRSEASISAPMPLAPRRLIHPRVTKLDIDSSFFHPSGSEWMSDFLSYSPITSFTVSLNSKSSADFIQHGFKTLLTTVPRLQSLSLLNVDARTIESIMPRLRPFAALKHLTICLDRHLSASSQIISISDTATPFAPGNLERLSVCPQLIDYMILGTVTALKIKEFEIIYERHAQPVVAAMSRHVLKVRDFYEKLAIPMSVVVTLSCVRGWAFLHSPKGGAGSSSSESEEGLRPGSNATAGVSNLANLIEAQYRADLKVVETIQVELAPYGLQGRRNIQDILKLLSFFPSVKTLHLRGATDFRDSVSPLLVPFNVQQSIVQPIYSACRSLTLLHIADMKYLRPLVDL